MTEQKKINFNINDGDPFFAHELSMNFNPTQFIFDFKSVTPRMDIRNRDGSIINIKHNVVMVEPYHAKKIIEVLSSVVKKYEKQFGKINKPKAIAKIEKKNADKKKNIDDKNEKTAGIRPTYLG